MLCPTCGADVPESQFCQNCGNELEQAENRESDSQPETAGEQLAGVYQWNDVPADDGPQKAAAPGTALALAAVGLALGAVGFGFVTSIPGFALCAAALLLAAKYRREGKDVPHRAATVALGVAGMAAAALTAALFVSTGAPLVQSIGGTGQGENAPEATSEESSAASAKAPAPAAVETTPAATDPRAFDSLGNPTLYAVCALSGSDLQEQLEAAGYQWVESANTWMSKSGAVLEAQDAGGMLDQAGIARLDEGASGSAVAFVIMATGYESPDAALAGMSAGVTVSDSYSAEDGEIAMAVVRGSGKEKRLVAVTQTGDGQQTALVFTAKAVSDGLFAKVTGVDAGDSIDDVWKVVNAG